LQDGYNRKGLISEDGKKKQAFFLFQKAYSEHAVGKAEWCFDHRACHASADLPCMILPTDIPRQKPPNLARN